MELMINGKATSPREFVRPERTTWYKKYYHTRYWPFIQSLISQDLIETDDHFVYLKKHTSKKLIRLIKAGIFDGQRLSFNRVKEILSPKNSFRNSTFMDCIVKYFALFEFEDQLPSCSSFIALCSEDDYSQGVLKNASSWEDLFLIIYLRHVKKGKEVAPFFDNYKQKLIDDKQLIAMVDFDDDEGKAARNMFNTTSSEIVRLIKLLPESPSKINDGLVLSIITAADIKYLAATRRLLINAIKEFTTSVKDVSVKLLKNNTYIKGIREGYVPIKYSVLDLHTPPAEDKFMIDYDGYVERGKRIDTLSFYDFSNISERYKNDLKRYFLTPGPIAFIDKARMKKAVMDYFKEIGAGDISVSTLMDYSQRIIANDSLQPNTRYMQNKLLCECITFFRDELGYDNIYPTVVESIDLYNLSTDTGERHDKYSDSDIEKLIEAINVHINSLKTNEELSKWLILKNIIIIFSNTSIRLNSFLNADRKDIVERTSSSGRKYFEFTGLTKKSDINPLIDYTLYPYMHKLLEVSDSVRNECHEFKNAMILYKSASHFHEPQKFNGKILGGWLKRLCDEVGINYYGIYGLRNKITEENLINSINNGFSDREQKIMNGHSTSVQIKSYSSPDVIRLNRECFKFMIGDIDFNTFNTEYDETDLVEEGTGYCTSKDCNGLDCLTCPSFRTTVQRLEYFKRYAEILNNSKGDMDETQRIQKLDCINQYITAISERSED